jgi:hypothetical protein
LSGVISNASESAREAIVNGCADHLTWSSVCHHDGVGVLCAGSGSRLAIAHCDLEVGFEGNVVTIRRSVITRIGSAIPFGAFMLALSEIVPVAAALSLPVAL